MLRIGEFSKLCRVTIKCLRYYDEVGLLKPELINSENGYRFYSNNQLVKMGLIVELKELGFTIEEILFITGKNITPSHFKELLERKRTEVSDIIKAENNKLNKINIYIKEISEEKFMFDVKLKELPEVIVASTRTIIKNYDDLFKVVPAMGEKMKKHGAVCSKPEYCFNIYHDGEYKENDIDVEICEAVEKKLADKDGVIYKKISLVKTAACLYHKGPYKTLGKSYGILLEWIEKNGYKISQNPRESYIDGCWNKDSEEDWLTEIQIPVELAQGNF
ncbi:MAG TPA: MerR family transcriptional regulator [Spirochaetota bacterium]|nr:MerR family transcriptional regulator [Spirochaetota bacterium]